MTRIGENSDICWSSKDKRGHFERTNTHLCPPKGKHKCFVVHQLPRSQISWDETETDRAGTIALVFGSSRDHTDGWMENKTRITHAVLTQLQTIGHWIVPPSIYFLLLWVLMWADAVHQWVETITSTLLRPYNKTTNIVLGVGWISASITLLAGAGLIAMKRNSEYPCTTMPLNIPGVICVEGNIGSGKSTLISGLQRTGLRVFQEPVKTRWGGP